ncbi:hypothetical protein [Lacrimispora sp.]|uniref:hypothetical protein n=1 Tax=Lacrimispora sp. TaxID=2719234 RepID=UPI00289EECDC|nr:hypothetical protein [Lacrimispora sp.]
MKNKIKKGFTAMFLVAPLILGCAGTAHAEETFIEIKKEYRTAIKEEDGRSQFKEIYEKDGIVYRLKSVHTDNVEEIYPGDIITYDSDPFVGNPEEYAPGEEVEKEGKRYTLKTIELTKILTEEITKYSKASILYEGVEYIDSLPQDAQVKVINEDLKQELNVILPAVDYKEESAYWDYNFSFPITVSGYDADSYMLGQTEISNRSPLIDHAILFLSYLNLPSQYYEISSIEWDGDPVSKDGEMIRNATAHGRKFVKDIRGIYGGEVTFPSIEANVYHGTYKDAEAENQTEQIIYKKEVTATYDRDGRKGFWNFLKWLQKNSVTMSILAILLIMLLLLLIVNRVRNRNRVRKRNLYTKKSGRNKD